MKQDCQPLHCSAMADFLEEEMSRVITCVILFQEGRPPSNNGSAHMHVHET